MNNIYIKVLSIYGTSVYFFSQLKRNIKDTFIKRKKKSLNALCTQTHINDQRQ